MSVYAGIAVVCTLYFGAFYYMLLFGDAQNLFGMYALGGFFGTFLFLGLGGIELIIKLVVKKNA